MDFRRLLVDVANSLVSIDSSGKPFKGFRPGVGPYGEPQLIKLVCSELNKFRQYDGAKTGRCPDLLIPGQWAIEFKIVRPFGDNGKSAENWSVNLLHPYQGNTSLLGDCLKLQELQSSEKRKAVIAVGYEHEPPQVSLAPLIQSFELIAKEVLGIQLGPKTQEIRRDLIHPVHQRLTVTGWELYDSR